MGEEVQCDACGRANEVWQDGNKIALARQRATLRTDADRQITGSFNCR